MTKYCKCNIPCMDEITRHCMNCHRIIKSAILSIRKHWKINPLTHIKESDKIYNRKKAKRKVRKELKEE